MVSHTDIDTLEMKNDGQIYIRASLRDDTTKYWFLFDTGASGSMIDEELVKKYDLEGCGSRNIIDANRQRGAVEKYHLEKIKIGQTSFEGFRFVQTVSEESTCFGKKKYGIIGTNIMRKANWLIDYSAQKIYMIKKEGIQFSGNGVYALPFSCNFFSGNPIVSFKVNGVLVKDVIFDTGNSGSINLPIDIYKKNEAVFKMENQFNSYGEHDVSVFGTTDEEILRTVVDSMELGSMKLQHQLVSFESKTAKMIGNALFSTNSIYLDYKNMEIKLLNNGEKRTVSMNKRTGFGLSLNFYEDSIVRVSQISKNSPADLAGIQYGEEVLSINGEIYEGDKCGFGAWGHSMLSADSLMEIEIKDKGLIKLAHGKY